MRAGLSRRQRLLDASSFQRILRRGRRREAPLLTLVALRTDGGPTRLGLAVSRRVGGAVKRNRAKRLVREAFRQRKSHGFEIVVLAKPGLASATLAGVAQQVGMLMERLENPSKDRRDKRASASD